MLNLFLLSIFVGYEVGNCFLIASPKNTATVSGERLSLECSIEGNESFVREWTLKRASDNPGTSFETQLIFSHWKSEAMYTISNVFSNFGAQVDSFGSGVLYANSSTTADAGLYTCAVEVKKSIFRYTAQVVILQTTPHCEASFQTGDFLTVGDRISMRCIVTYRGNLAPSIQWRRHQGNGDMEAVGKPVTEGIQANVVAGCNISSTLTIIVNSATDNFYFSCKLYFPSLNSNNESRIANNAPEFTYTWMSPVIKGRSQTTAGILVYATRSYSADVTQDIASTNWFVISLALGAAMLVVIVLMAIITTALCCRMKKRTKHVEKRTTIKAETKSEELQEIPLSAKASGPCAPEEYDVMQDDCYEKIGDVNEEDDASNMASLGNQCHAKSPGYLSLLSPCKLESSTYSEICNYDKPADYKQDLTGPVEVGQVESPLYLTSQDSDVDRLTPVGNAFPYLQLVRDTGDVSAEENQSPEYLNPYADIQKEVV